MRRRTEFFVLLVPLLWLGCAEPGGEVVTDDAPAATELAADPAAIEDEVAQVRDSWVQSAERDDAAAVAALYTEDARLVLPDGEAVEGRQSIQESLTEGFATTSDLEVTSEDVIVGTDVVSDMGTFTETVTTPDGEQTVSGTYIVVLERQPDGAWRIAHHLASSPPAPAPGQE